MKKQILSTAILAVLASANAQAAAVTGPTIDPSTTTTLYIGGASAQRTYIQEAVTGTAGSGITLAAQDKLCDTTQPIYWWGDNNGTNAAGKNYDAWYCTKQPSNTALASAKAHLLIHKRSAGGSDFGVAPIVNPQNIGFLNIANSNCTDNGTSTVGGISTVQLLCSSSTLVNATPDLGVSDVDPGKFVGLNVTAGSINGTPFSAIKASDLAKITVKSTSTVVFGEQVTSHLFNALQQAQIATGYLAAGCAGQHTEACLPSLSSATIAALHTGAAFDWDLIQVGNTGLGLYSWASANDAADAPAVSSVHIVRRANGSGTQAQHGIHFLSYPCDTTAASATLPANDNGQSEGVEGYVIHEASSAGNVNASLKALDTGTSAAALATGTHAAGDFAGGVRWAVGLNSLEQTTNANYEFVKVDGVAPTLANVVAGKYHDWAENTFQYNSVGGHPVTTDVAAVRDALIAKAARPEVLSALNTTLTHAFGNGAYLASPSLYPITTGSATYNATTPVNVFTLAPAGSTVDNCRVPTPYNDGTDAPAFSL